MTPLDSMARPMMSPVLSPAHPMRFDTESRTKHRASIHLWAWPTGCCTLYLVMPIRLVPYVWPCPTKESYFETKGKNKALACHFRLAGPRRNGNHNLLLLYRWIGAFWLAEYSRPQSPLQIICTSSLPISKSMTEVYKGIPVSFVSCNARSCCVGVWLGLAKQHRTSSFVLHLVGIKDGLKTKRRIFEQAWYKYEGRRIFSVKVKVGKVSSDFSISHVY